MQTAYIFRESDLISVKKRKKKGKSFQVKAVATSIELEGPVQQTNLLGKFCGSKEQRQDNKWNYYS